MRARPGRRQRRLRRVRVHLAQPGAALGLLRPPRGAAPLRPRRVDGAAPPHRGLRPVVVLARPPRPDARGRQPASSTTSSRAATSVSRPLPAGRHAVRPSRRRSGRRTAPGLPVRRLRRRRDGRRHGRRLHPRPEPASPTSTTSPTARSRRARSTKLAPYTRARWAIRHGRYDFGSYSMLASDLVGWDAIDDVRRGDARQRQRATSCSRWTRCSPPWTRRPATGGACRRRTTTSRPRRRTPRPAARRRRRSVEQMRERAAVALLRLLPRRLVLPGATGAGSSRTREFRRRLDTVASPVGEGHDHPEVRDRLLAR